MEREEERGGGRGKERSESPRMLTNGGLCWTTWWDGDTIGAGDEAIEEEEEEEEEEEDGDQREEMRLLEHEAPGTSLFPLGSIPSSQGLAAQGRGQGDDRDLRSFDASRVEGERDLFDLLGALEAQGILSRQQASVVLEKVEEEGRGDSDTAAGQRGGRQAA
eukprot:421196-Hanusia_phi.AAC.2